MTINDIKKIIDEVYPISEAESSALKIVTAQGTFEVFEPTTKNPVGAIKGNRLNSGKLRSQLMFFQDPAMWNGGEDSARKTLRVDQRAFVQVGPDVWDIYAGTITTGSNEPYLWRHITGLKNFLSNLDNLDFGLRFAGCTEELFYNWLLRQPARNRPGTMDPTQAQNYCRHLREMLRDPLFADIGEESLFFYTDEALYSQKKSVILAHASYPNYNASHANGEPNAALNHYERFLQDSNVKKLLKEIERISPYLAAIRTKPFVLLAGISGTGKSRLVRQLARGCCPAGHDLGKDAQGKVDSAKKPGNFEMIPVRPNWHDSTELMGYVTRLTDDNQPKYVIKPFVKFLVKAAIWKDVPFFLCLDEMNLAPVEQYFAEYLSVVETRKKDGNDIVSDVLVNFDQPEIDVAKTVQELMADWIAVAADGTVSEKIAGAKTVYDAIVADKGVRIPKNFIVMGTVNMDETTCSFSRKVLDRAMTFELNEVDMDAGLETDNSVPYGAIQPPSSAIATDVEGFDFYAANKDVCEKIKTYLNAINAVLDGTPFKFAYRSRNEIMLYCIERMKGGIGLPQALDEATSMKILSRIEGDEQKLRIAKRDAANNVVKDANGHPVMVCLLDVLAETIPMALKAANDGNDLQPACTVCTDKLTYMAGRLDGGFTNFFV